MNLNALLQQAIDLATKAHAGQLDKAGQAYIGHPLRVMHQLETTQEKIVGVLHDAVEDSELTLDDLTRQGFPVEITAAIAAITKSEHEEYETYLQRVMANPIALRVKIADMTDNLDISRIAQPTAKDYERLKKYQSVLPRLQAALESL